MNNEFFNRQQYIRRSNELKKGPDMDSLIQGNKKRVEKNQRLDELSLNSNSIVSGNIVRRNIVNSSSSCITTVNNIVDNDVYESNDKVTNNKVNLNPNMGKNNFMNNLK